MIDVMWKIKIVARCRKRRRKETMKMKIAHTNILNKVWITWWSLTSQKKYADVHSNCGRRVWDNGEVEEEKKIKKCESIYTNAMNGHLFMCWLGRKSTCLFMYVCLCACVCALHKATEIRWSFERMLNMEKPNTNNLLLFK